MNATSELDHVDAPLQTQEFSAVLDRVVSGGQPVVIRRLGEEVAALISVGQLQVLQEAIAQREAERLASEIDWNRLTRNCVPAADWFDGDEPRPF